MNNNNHQYPLAQVQLTLLPFPINHHMQAMIPAQTPSSHCNAVAPAHLLSNQSGLLLASTAATATATATSSTAPAAADNDARAPPQPVHRQMKQGYVKVAAHNASGTTPTEPSDSSQADTSSLSSDTDDPARTPSESESEESLETSIAYLREKQLTLQRFSVELQQDELYKAFMVKEDLKAKEDDEQESWSSSSFTLSDDEDDDNEDNNLNTNIWVRAKKILRSLSRHRGVLYHPAGRNQLNKKRAAPDAAPSSSSSNAKKSLKTNTGKQKRRVRFGPDVDLGSTEDADQQDKEQPRRTTIQQDADLVRASKCARFIIDRTPQTVCRLITSKDFAASQGTGGIFPTLPPLAPTSMTMSSMTTALSCPTDTTDNGIGSVSASSNRSNRTTTSADTYMVSVQTIVSEEAKSLPNNGKSVPLHTAG